ncbi:VOC family protein [Tessaracoccus sp. MC1865]|uniref:VOC family protein n=2 Tax=Tessaracoccus TaxID=72763 RepID=UPI001AE82042|nr:VOC family protein [Tessaracoccus sp. MC1865]QTO38418.1 VOC family protein [Tessaracoccus sp. MC1865]
MLRMSPYIAFNGQATAALEFYQSVFGGELTTTPFADYSSAPELEHKIMHGQLDAEGFTLMAADTPTNDAPEEKGNTTIVIWGEDAETGRRWFDALAEGGTVVTPFEQQMWGDHYGDLTDQFGVEWGINIAAG